MFELLLQVLRLLRHIMLGHLDVGNSAGQLMLVISHEAADCNL